MKTLLTIAALLVALVCATGQGSTTQEEYNYVTKGISTSIENGIDLKKGYWINYQDDFTPLSSTITEGNYNFIFQPLIRKSDSSLAAIIIKAKSNVSRKTYWLCLPNDNHELYMKYLEELKKFDYYMLSAYVNELSEKFMSGRIIEAAIDKIWKNPATTKQIEKLLFNH